MKLIKSSAKIIEQKPGLEGIYEQIELAGRTCYKSERKEGTTAKDFVDRMIASGHGAMLEHGTVYLKYRGADTKDNPMLKYINNPYSKVITQSHLLESPKLDLDKAMKGEYTTKEWDEYNKQSRYIAGKNYNISLLGETYYVTTNYRVLVELDALDDLEYLCEPTEFHEKRHTVRFITDIGVGRELLRHRVQQEDYELEPEPLFNYANESTRYCNYSKDKFGNELTFIIPSWFDIPEARYKYEDQNPFLTAGGTVEEYGYDDDPNVWFEDGAPFKEANRCTAIDDFFKALDSSSEAYFTLLHKGYTPQQARAVLPLATKSELVMTGFESDWSKVFDLRVKGTTGKPHPDCKALVEPIMNEFIERGWYDNK